MSVASAVVLLLRLLASAAIGATVFVVIRWMGRQSRIVQALVAGGLLARATAGVGLFWISYLRLPVLPSLQLGMGFWSPMLDAVGYFRTAETAVEHGLATIRSDSASPFFTRALAIWLQVVGVSPAAAVLLNLCLYVGCCAVLTRLFRPVGRWRDDLPLIISIGAVSFCPVLLIDSTQPLKDDFFLSLVIAVCVSAMLLFRSLVQVRPLQMVGAVVVLGLAIYGAAGIRSYYPVMVLIPLAGALTVLALAAPRRRRFGTVVVAAMVLAVLWYANARGAGPQVRPTVEERRRVAESLHWYRSSSEASVAIASATSSVTTARENFVAAGGATNIVEPRRSAPEQIATGVAVIVVPISFLKAASVVSFAGGRGMLAATDADTLFMDCSLIAILVLLYQRRRLIGDRRAFVCFGLGLSLLTVVLLGYVVTNFGTLFRMRYLVAAPLWTLALAMPPFRTPTGQEDK